MTKQRINKPAVQGYAIDEGYHGQITRAAQQGDARAATVLETLTKPRTISPTSGNRQIDISTYISPDSGKTIWVLEFIRLCGCDGYVTDFWLFGAEPSGNDIARVIEDQNTKISLEEGTIYECLECGFVTDNPKLIDPGSMGCARCNH